MTYSSKPIIHFANDNIFIEAAYKTYEKAFPGKNLCVIILKDESHKIQHLSKIKTYKLIYAKDNFVNQAQAIISNAKLLVFHGLYGNNAKIAAKLNTKGITTIGNVFGTEVYSNPYLFDNKLHGEKTRNEFILTKETSTKEPLIIEFKRFLKKYYDRLLRCKRDKWLVIIDAIKKMDYLGGFYEEKFQLYQDLRILKKTAKPLFFTYYPIGVIIKENQPYVDDVNILLGNSAAYENNHLEAFDFLQKLNIADRSVITPLSYGRNDYAEEIIRIGHNKLKGSFVPITTFLPLDEYQKVLQTCGILVMNHYRSQAAGNILTALHMGAKVYLSNKNILYRYFKRIGCFIYCIEEELLPENVEALQLLSLKQMKHNRNILKKEISVERIERVLQQTLGHKLKC